MVAGATSKRCQRRLTHHRRQRLNGTSCLAILTANPRLLDVDCKTPEQMHLVNGLCRFVEMARPM
jgi:hypothetical protein